MGLRNESEYPPAGRGIRPAQPARGDAPAGGVGLEDYAAQYGGVRTATDYERSLRNLGLKDWRVHQLVGEAVRDGRVIDDGVLVDGQGAVVRPAGTVTLAEPEPLRRAGGLVGRSSYEIGGGTGPDPLGVRPRRGEWGFAGEQLFIPGSPADQPAAETPVLRDVNQVADRWQEVETGSQASIEVTAMPSSGLVSARLDTTQREEIAEEAAFRDAHAAEINEALKRPDYEAVIAEGQREIQRDPNAIEPTTGERWTVVIAAAQGRINDIDALDPEVLAYSRKIRAQIDQSNVPTALRYANFPGLSVADAWTAASSPHGDGGFRITDREVSQIRDAQYVAVVDSAAMTINFVSVPRLGIAAAQGIGRAVATRSLRTAGPAATSVPRNVADELVEEQGFQLLYVPAGGSPLLNPLNVVEGAGIGTEAGAQSLAAAGRRGYRTGLPFDDQPPPVTAPQLLPVTYSGRPGLGLINPGDPTPTRFTPYGTAFYTGGRVTVTERPAVDTSDPLAGIRFNVLGPTGREGPATFLEGEGYRPMTGSPPGGVESDARRASRESRQALVDAQRTGLASTFNLPFGTSYGEGYASGYSTSTRLREVTTPSGLRVLVSVEDDQATIQPEGAPQLQLQLQEQTVATPGVAPAQQPAVAPATTPEIVQAPQPALAPVPAVSTSIQTQLQAQTARQEELAGQPSGLIVTQPEPAEVSIVTAQPQAQTLTQTQTQAQPQVAREEEWVVLPNGMLVPAAAVSQAVRPVGVTVATAAPAPAVAPQPAPALAPALSPAMARWRTTTTPKTPTPTTARVRAAVEGPGSGDASPLSPADTGEGFPAKVEFVSNELNQADMLSGEVNESPIDNTHRQTLRVTQRTTQDTRGRRVDTGGVTVGVDRTGRARVIDENEKTPTSRLPEKPKPSGQSDKSGPSGGNSLGGGGGQPRRRRRRKDDWRDDDRAYGFTGGAPVVRIVAK